jgi:hypothetical protein
MQSTQFQVNARCITRDPSTAPGTMRHASVHQVPRCSGNTPSLLPARVVPTAAVMPGWRVRRVRVRSRWSFPFTLPRVVGVRHRFEPVMRS